MRGELVAALLPESIGPYLAVIGVGFLIGTWGHLARSRVAIVIGIVLVFAATILFPLAVELSGDRPPQPR